MSTTTGLTVRYGEGKHIIFVNNPEGFAKVSKIRDQSSSSLKWFAGLCRRHFCVCNDCDSHKALDSIPLSSDISIQSPCAISDIDLRSCRNLQCCADHFRVSTMHTTFQTLDWQARREMCSDDSSLCRFSVSSSSRAIYWRLTNT